MNSATKASAGTSRGHRPSQASAAKARPILRLRPGAWMVVVWLASIAVLSLSLYRLQPGRKPLGGEHLVDRRPGSSDRKSRAIHHDLRRQGPAIIGRGHHGPIGACRAYHDQVSRSQRRQITILREIVA